jgi:hypothetical protein
MFTSSYCTETSNIRFPGSFPVIIRCSGSFGAGGSCWDIHLLSGAPRRKSYLSAVLKLGPMVQNPGHYFWPEPREPWTAIPGDTEWTVDFSADVPKRDAIVAAFKVREMVGACRLRTHRGAARVVSIWCVSLRRLWVEVNFDFR